VNLLEFSRVSRSYVSQFDELSDVSFGIARGEVVALFGHRGAGKTTCMELAIGLLHPHEGKVRLFGLDPARDPRRARQRVGFVRQMQALPPFSRVRDVMRLHAELYEHWDDGLAFDLLDRLKLDPSRKVESLSRLQARRVTFLCALAHRPELLLLDGPATGIEPQAQQDLLDIALARCAEDGTAVLFSARDLAQVEQAAQRVVVLQDGRLRYDGPWTGLSAEQREVLGTTEQEQAT
jgi:ABC-2 type transport system ATP-binding protein